jgi:hypothetical protein
MSFKRNLLLTAAGAILMLNNINVIAQETTENPIDTLARTVQSITDDLNKIKRLKITGYIQPQFQYVDSAGASTTFAGGDFPVGSSSNSRFTIRRGRFKFTYDYTNVKYMLNVDITEKAVGLRETYVKITDPWKKMYSVAVGLSQVPFGFEVTQSSSERETPERARFNQTLFPTERDLGIFGTIVVPKSSKLYGLKLDASLLNGVGGINPEFDSFKDLTGRAQYSRTTKSEKTTYAIGTSYYYGGYRIGKPKDYNSTTLANGDNGYSYATDTANYNRKAQRIYMGVDAQITFDWRAGFTTLRADFVEGQQPGTSTASRTTTGAPTTTVYHRNFNGAYFYFIQDIGESKFQVVAKYDWYDPNVTVKGREIGKAGTNTNAGDIRFDTYGFGITYRMNANVKLMTYYDIVKNEKTLVKGFENDLKDNVLTIRMQCKF